MKKEPCDKLYRLHLRLRLRLWLRLHFFITHLRSLPSMLLLFCSCFSAPVFLLQFLCSYFSANESTSSCSSI